MASKVIRRQLWSWLSVEARPVLAWAELNALLCLAHVSWTHSYRLRRLCIAKPLIALGGVSRNFLILAQFSALKKRAIRICGEIRREQDDVLDFRIHAMPGTELRDL